MIDNFATDEKKSWNDRDMVWPMNAKNTANRKNEERKYEKQGNLYLQSKLGHWNLWGI